MTYNLKQWVCTLLVCTMAGTGMAQVKKRLSIDDMADWKTIRSLQLSANGHYASYELKPLRGEGALVINRLEDLTADTVVLGKGATFTADSKRLVYQVAVSKLMMKLAKKRKLAKDKMPMPRLVIRDLETGNSRTFENLNDFKVAEKATRWMAFSCRPDSLVKTKDRIALSDLVLYNFETGDTTIIHQMVDYTVDREGHSIIYLTHAADSTELQRLYRFDTQKGESTMLMARKGSFKQLQMSDSGALLAFYFSANDKKDKTYSLYLGKGNAEPQIIADKNSSELPAGWAPSINATPRFSDDDERLYFGTAPSPRPDMAKKDEDAPNPQVDIWSWTDKELMPAQLLHRNREAQRAYLAMYQLKTKKLLQLADTTMPEVSYSTSQKGSLLVGRSTEAYEMESSWTGETLGDYYLLNLKSGSKSLLLSGIGGCALSPGEKYVVWFARADSCWMVQDVRNSKAKPLRLKSDKVDFVREDNDRPMDAVPYGICGWSENDRYLYLYDKYDIWQFDPTGKEPPVNRTSPEQDNSKISFIYVKTERDEAFLPNDRWLLSSFDDETKQAGYYELNLKSNAAPRKLIGGDYMFKYYSRAADADLLLWTRQSCSEFPDLWMSDSHFSQPTKISEANPQQDNFIWATRELVNWKSFTGEELQGILYFPDNFSPDSVYPMLVNFYEQKSQTLNAYTLPSPSRSTINRMLYASNGYLVFIPDITYRVGYPGQSAYEAIVSGTNALLSTRPYIDAQRIGLQGQSWGGYQTAYLITQTDMFAAAMAGAPVSNMTSAYGGIRWEKGESRMYQYERSQSRIGGTLWEKPMRYIENSPLFYAPKITTPLLMMSNDNDGAVPWYQGIELFMAMRRLQKPAWLLNYNNEPHNLKSSSWDNRVDLSTRMMQFFDHYLKGRPMPRWMSEGIPASEKGRALGYELD